MNGSRMLASKPAPGSKIASTEIYMDGKQVRMLESDSQLAASRSPDQELKDALITSTLRTISSACETYATVNSGRYPSTVKDLTEANPAYLDQDYCGALIDGVRYTCEFLPNGYLMKATTGEGKVYSIATGGILNK